jgi:hypothetical protein
MRYIGRVNASCTVDDLGQRQFEVRVWGEAPFDHERTYTLSAKDDNSAAEEGLRLFCDEMECLRDAEAKED